MLLVVELVGVTPAMAKGTASVKPTGRAEKATAVKLEALEPGVYGKAGRHERPLQVCKARPAMGLRHYHKTQ